MISVKVNGTPVEMGCVIDGSHISADDFNARLVDFASGLGYSLSSTDKATIEIAQTEHLRNLLPEIHEEAEGRLAERLLEMADAAEAWLNENTEEPGVWYVEEQSLFLDDHDVMRLDGRCDD
jgi:hypothetical protein